MRPWRLNFTWFFKWTGYYKMEILIKRLEWTDNGIFGHLDINGFDCVTLENHDKVIPAGSYKATFYSSPRLHREVLLLHDVPGRTMIEIHPANWASQLEGCIAVGRERSGMAIDSSQDTMNDLLEVVRGADSITVKII